MSKVQAGYGPGTSFFPSTIVLDSGDTLRLGDTLPGSEAGQVQAYEGLHLPDGTARVFVEVDSRGRARTFEFWYAPETQYADVVAFHEQRMGAPERRYERLAGACTVWQEGGYAFELCRSREPAEHGEVIAHVWPR